MRYFLITTSAMVCCIQNSVEGNCCDMLCSDDYSEYQPIKYTNDLDEKQRLNVAKYYYNSIKKICNDFKKRSNENDKKILNRILKAEAEYKIIHNQNILQYLCTISEDAKKDKIDDFVLGSISKLENEKDRKTINFCTTQGYEGINLETTISRDDGCPLGLTGIIQTISSDKWKTTTKDVMETIESIENNYDGIKCYSYEYKQPISTNNLDIIREPKYVQSRGLDAGGLARGFCTWLLNYLDVYIFKKDSVRGDKRMLLLPPISKTEHQPFNMKIFGLIMQWYMKYCGTMYLQWPLLYYRILIRLNIKDDAQNKNITMADNITFGEFVELLETYFSVQQQYAKKKKLPTAEEIEPYKDIKMKYIPYNVVNAYYEVYHDDRLKKGDNMEQWLGFLLRDICSQDLVQKLFMLKKAMNLKSVKAEGCEFQTQKTAEQWRKDIEAKYATLEWFLDKNYNVLNNMNCGNIFKSAIRMGISEIDNGEFVYDTYKNKITLNVDKKTLEDKDKQEIKDKWARNIMFYITGCEYQQAITIRPANKEKDHGRVHTCFNVLEISEACSVMGSPEESLYKGILQPDVLNGNDYNTI